MNSRNEDAGLNHARTNLLPLGARHVRRTLQDGDDGVQVVPVHGSDVVQAQLLKQRGPAATDHAARVLVNLRRGFLRTGWQRVSAQLACMRPLLPSVHAVLGRLLLPTCNKPCLSADSGMAKESKSCPFRHRMEQIIQKAVLTLQISLVPTA